MMKHIDFSQMAVIVEVPQGVVEVEEDMLCHEIKKNAPTLW